MYIYLAFIEIQRIKYLCYSMQNPLTILITTICMGSFLIMIHARSCSTSKKLKRENYVTGKNTCNCDYWVNTCMFGKGPNALSLTHLQQQTSLYEMLNLHAYIHSSIIIHHHQLIHIIKYVPSHVCKYICVLSKYT